MLVKLKKTAKPKKSAKFKKSAELKKLRLAEPKKSRAVALAELNFCYFLTCEFCVFVSKGMES